MIEFGKETFQINLGYYRSNYNTSASVGTSTGTGFSISGEDDLNLDNSVGVGRVTGYWRFADRHRLMFGYYNLDRDATGTLNKNIGPIRIDRLGVNDTILAGSSIHAESTWDIYTLGYAYSFYKTKNAEIAAGIGVHVARIGIEVTGTLNTLNNGVQASARAGSASDVTAPLPVVMLAADWAPAERWRVKGQLGWLKANLNDVDATVTDLSVAAEYRLFRNFGIGAGYSMFKLDGDITKANWNGSLDWRTGGWQVYGSLVF
jgi:hypothetical protein